MLVLFSLIIGSIVYRYFSLFGLGIYFILSILFVIPFKVFKHYILLGQLLLIVSLLLNSSYTIFQVGEKLYIEGKVVKTFDRKENYQRIEVVTKNNNKFSIATIGEEEFKLYDKVQGEITIVESNSFHNFNFSSIEDYYYINFINANAKSVSLKKYGGVNFFENIKLQIINKTNTILEKGLSPTSQGLIKKLLLADSSDIDEDVEELYQNGGLSHLLAISGLHIFIIIGVLDWILKYLKFDFNSRFILISFLLINYAFILSFPPSINRALLMFILKNIFEIKRVKVSNLSVILLSAIILLTINYRLIFDLGFQLSYGSVVGIALFSGSFFRERKSFILNALDTYLSVNIIIFPILVLYFNNFNLLSFVTNIFMTPIITSVLILTYIGVILSFILGQVGMIFYIIDFILQASHYYLELFLTNFEFFIRVFNPNMTFMLFYYVFLYILRKKEIFGLLYRQRKLVYLIFSTLILFQIGDLLNPVLYIGFLDVGQGDSSYIMYKDLYIQIDTGGSGYSTFNPGEEITAKAITKRGIPNINLLILSHFDGDHVLGTKKLIEDGYVKNILVNRIEKENELYQQISNMDVSILLPNEEKEIFLDKDFSIELLNTDINEFTESNDASLVLLVKYKNKKILFTGDISSEVEDKISERIGKVNILKVSHHGSEFSSSLDFLNKARPDYSVISVGKNNPYGHPNNVVINNLKIVSSEILRTDLDGEIIFEIGENILPYTYSNYRVKVDYIFLIFSAIISYALVVYIKKEEELNEISRFKPSLN